MQFYRLFKGIGSCLVPLFFASACLHASTEEESFECLMKPPYQTCTIDICPPVEQPCCENSFKFFAIGTYLYWNTNISGLESNIGKSTGAQATINDITSSKTSEFNIDPHFDWSSGYRIGIGMQLPDSNASVEAFWTQYSNRARRKSHGSNSIVNYGHAKVSLEQIDAIFAYNCAGSTFSIKPFVGIRAAKIRHSLKSSMTTDINIVPDAFAIGINEFDGHQHFKGIGPTLGVYGDWTMGCGFGLYGEAAFSILYGDYNIDFEDTEVVSAPVSIVSATCIRKHLHRFNHTLDLGLGLFWNTSIKCIDVGIRLGYELHEYDNISYLGAAYGGDIAFNGGILSVEIGF